MKTQNFLFVLTFCVVIMSCRKDEVSPEIIEEETPTCDTISPGDYFPAYPESWWEYSVIGGGTYIIEIDTGYHMIKDDQYCVPRWKNQSYSSWYIEGNSLTRLDGGGLPGTPMWHPGGIYRIDTVGYRWYSSFAFSKTHQYYSGTGGPDFSIEIISLDTTVTLLTGPTYDSVLVIEEIRNNYPDYVFRDYFVKDVGMIRRDSLNAADSLDWIEILSLDNYFIGQ